MAVVCLAAGMLLRQLRGDLSGVLRIGAFVLIFGMLISQMGALAGDLVLLFEGEQVEEYASILLKALGVAVLTQLCGDICRDCGETGTAQGVELAGKLTILALCVPLLSELLEYASRLLESD